ncbi:MAG: hypothetical protein JRN20_09585 [Nitrososphaerota archaeon]|jgi:hypothetical protein|nr:hypothetical protein [Nitrososphaerota archaeon]MDG6923316.1 hypothetical protein [Nitrososphaerota archaeon]
MDSRQQFVIIFAGLSMISFVVLTFLNTIDFGIYASSFTIIYFALRLILNPKIRISVDILSLILLAIFVYFVAERVIAILG